MVRLLEWDLPGILSQRGRWKILLNVSFWGILQWNLLKSAKLYISFILFYVLEFQKEQSGILIFLV